MAIVLSEKGFGKLLREVGALLEVGRGEAEAAAGHVLAVTYWKVGARIGREGLSERAGYGAGVVERLGDELGVSQAALRRAVQFARLYDAPPRPGLSWAHYQELLSVADPAAREAYAVRAVADGWTRQALRSAIRERALGSGEDAGAGAALRRPVDGSYLYRCEVKQVVDGDTLLVHVDLGFEVIRVQRVRLANVDAPEAKTQAGKKTAQWLRARLAAAEQVVLRTDKLSDVHGRYVAHVFYSGDAEASADAVFKQGQYLNAELVAQGLAKAVPG